MENFQLFFWTDFLICHAIANPCWRPMRVWRVAASEFHSTGPGYFDWPNGVCLHMPDHRLANGIWCRRDSFPTGSREWLWARGGIEWGWRPHFFANCDFLCGDCSLFECESHQENEKRATQCTASLFRLNFYFTIVLIWIQLNSLGNYRKKR